MSRGMEGANETPHRGLVTLVAGRQRIVTFDLKVGVAADRTVDAGSFDLFLCLGHRALPILPRAKAHMATM